MQPFILLTLPLLAAAQSSSSSAPATSTSAPPATNSGNGKYTYVGCYNETTFETGNPRALTMGVGLNDLWESDDTLTVDTCLDFCAKNNTKYAGLEYSRECWCGDFLNPDSAHLPDSQCNLTCAGNSSEACGQNDKLMVYNRTSAASGVWRDGSRYSAAYVAAATAMILGFGTLLL